VPEGAAGDPKFAARVMPGVEGAARVRHRPAKRRNLSVDDYVSGILAGERSVLSRAITLVESNHPSHEALAQEVLARILPQAGRSIRVGITGVPGAGKSTLIEALGCLLCDRGHRLAVLAVDPSSSVSGGSILGDKTRMERLVRHPHAFIRPSPSGGSLGGVARKSRETIMLCEAAGFDTILVETVGVGQNEVTVRSMVDFFLLIMIAGAGDELQGMKKGVIEIADLLARARLAAAEYRRVLDFLAPATPGWKTGCVTCSALVPETLEALWRIVEEFAEATRHTGAFAERRRRQAVSWLHAMVDEELLQRFYRDPAVKALLPGLEKQVAAHGLPVATAAHRLLEAAHRAAQAGPADG
jgi:LAO/AO transport system kinase